MPIFEKITGSAITALIDTLIQHKTLLKLTLMDTEYANLTRILRMADSKGSPHLVIDIPEGFEKAAAGSDDWRIYFEFSGPDQIKYAFTTVGGKIVHNCLQLKIPQALERRQRRELFRINAPEGTRILFSKDGNQIALEVINISIGGSLAAWVQGRTSGLDNSSLAVAQRLEDIVLVFPAEITQQPIRIEALEIKRIEHKSQQNRHELGLEFRKISNSEKRRLTDLIYELQRQYLRHRLPLAP
jgi:c-di-GMP-binding flagellar brake protein YcgR